MSPGVVSSPPASSPRSASTATPGVPAETLGLDPSAGAGAARHPPSVEPGPDDLTRVTLAFELTSDGIRGWVEDRVLEPRRFEGWLALKALLEQAATTTTEPLRESEPTP